MSSWFNYYFGSPQAGSSRAEQQSDSPERDEDDGRERASTSGFGVSPDVGSSLTDEQKDQIREVLLKAERSHKEAKVVIDAKHLSRLRTFGVQHSTVDHGDEWEQDFVVQDERLVQMDSLPETLEVTVLPAPPPSIASRCVGDKSSSQASSGRTSSLDQYSETQSPAQFIAEPSSYFSSSMCLLSTRINQWIKTLDTDEQICVNLDDEAINEGTDGATLEEEYEYRNFRSEELFVPESNEPEPNVQLDIYIDEVIEQAVLQSGEELKIHLENLLQLIDNFAQILTEEALTRSFIELKVLFATPPVTCALQPRLNSVNNCSNISSSFLFTKPTEQGQIFYVVSISDTDQTTATSKEQCHHCSDSDSEESEMCYSILSESEEPIENLEKSEIRNRTIVVARWIQSTFGQYGDQANGGTAPNEIDAESPTEYTQLKYTRAHDDSGLFIEKSNSTSSAEIERGGLQDYAIQHKRSQHITGKKQSGRSDVDTEHSSDSSEPENVNIEIPQQHISFDNNSSATSGVDRSFETEDEEPNAITNKTLRKYTHVQHETYATEEQKAAEQLNSARDSPSPVSSSITGQSSATSGADLEQSFDTDYGVPFAE
uniref:Protein unc-13 homolog A n=1 Tax=Steinernema glaseri TaxID=37863 RepID=A0A1I7ZKD7_9BILA